MSQCLKFCRDWNLQQIFTQNWEAVHVKNCELGGWTPANPYLSPAPHSGKRALSDPHRLKLSVCLSVCRWRRRRHTDNAIYSVEGASVIVRHAVSHDATLGRRLLYRKLKDVRQPVCLSVCLSVRLSHCVILLETHIVDILIARYSHSILVFGFSELNIVLKVRRVTRNGTVNTGEA